jgi:hypothetical protein
MRILLELCGMVEHILYKRWVLDYDCNRAKINQAVKELMNK